MSADEANVDADPTATPLGGRASLVLVCLYDPTSTGEPFTPLENVVCERIEYAEGPQPPQAAFRYLLDALAAADGYPTDFAELWPTDATGKGVVRPDDRVVVMTWNPMGDRVYLFDGFAQIPQATVAGATQAVTFAAVGVAARCFDAPIGYRFMRGSDDLEAGEPVEVDLPARFNPDGRPNRSPDDANYDPDADDPDPDVDRSFPVFVDEALTADPDPREFWTLGDAARHILGVYPEGGWVELPDFDDLDELLENRRPNEGTDYDPDDPATYEADPITVRDFDASNRPWPEALGELLSYAGFGMRWALVAGDDGKPENRLELYRLDATGDEPPKPVDLDELGAEIDPSRNTAEAFNLARDLNDVTNAFTLDVGPRRVEASFVLAPGFVPIPGDEAASERGKFLLANLRAAGASREDYEAYRLYVADEDGSGHWDPVADAWTEGEAIDLSELFPDEDDKPAYVARRRPGSRKLLAVDSKGEARQCELALCRNYGGPVPGVWDGSGDWQPIAGGWELLDDRLGVYVKCEDPEAWPIGEYTGPDPQEKSKTLRGITAQAAPNATNPAFFLRLTTVVDSDRAPTWSAAKRAASPTRFERRRRVDARDHFKQETISKRSAFAAPEDADVLDVDARDDTGDALAHAYQLRSTYERPPLVGSIRMPVLSTAYRVGDRIEKIRGREASLRSDSAVGGGEAATYPRVTRLVWTFADGLATALEFSDAAGRVQGV